MPDSFVALIVGVQSNKVPGHAGILIRLKGINYFHHFRFRGRPEVIDNFNPKHWLVYKIINLIKVDDESEVESFLSHCKRVCEKSKIVYSCTFDGSHYNAEGEFDSASGLPELGTCVGFCLNTIALYAIDHDSYLQLEDWDEHSVSGAIALDNYGQTQTFVKHPYIDQGLYNAYHKRISPTDYLCAAFFDKYPVRKEQIEEIAMDVLKVIDEKFNS